MIAWGKNYYGQLGDGNTIETELPVAVSGLTDVAGITASQGSDSLAFGPVMANVPEPLILGIESRRAPVSGGTAVTITGTNLTGATAVKFGSSSARSFSVSSPDSISAVAPAEPAGVVNVSVTTPSATTVESSVGRFIFTPTIAALGRGSGAAAGREQRDGHR